VGRSLDDLLVKFLGMFDESLERWIRIFVHRSMCWWLVNRELTLREWYKLLSSIPGLRYHVDEALGYLKPSDKKGIYIVDKEMCKQTP